MMSMEHNNSTGGGKSVYLIFFGMLAAGLAGFFFALSGSHPARAWQAYLINFLLWSSMAQGAVVFSAVMHVTHARWSGPLAGLAESFAAFFPLSFILFLLLFLGKPYIFPWLHENLHGKQVWLNLPFLFCRDGLGLLALYLIGFGYLYNDLQLKFDPRRSRRGWRKFIYNARRRNGLQAAHLKHRMTVWGGLYILAFAVVLSLLGFDLVMSADPHWVSTLFGAYTFVKAFYAGLGALIILAAVLHRQRGETSALTPSHFHDIGKLFFAFCLLWADFFYVQLVVIWYGNIPENTHYVIVRTMLYPWKPLAWTVFVLSFIMPFFILLNQKIKTRPAAMIVICTVAMAGIWLEHLLLLAPALNQHASRLPLGFSDGLITLGFLGLMVAALTYFLRLFPELSGIRPQEVH